MGKTSSYGDFKSSRVPRAKRTIRMKGSGEDDGKWYRCWYCGFPNNIDRNAIGDGEGFGADIDRVSPNTDGDIVINTTFAWVPDVVSGCSFCGCKNYR